ncbi:MAG: hypothetical protein HY675_13305 [Chloroflexi bacterium]|nr:hypothetical protein [Chloroflexota bacterium]
MAEYQVLEEDLRNYKEGDEVLVQIEDRDTFEHLAVRAIIYRSRDRLPDGDTLWIRALENGVMRPDPWAIKILDEIPHDEFAQYKYTFFHR